MSKIKCIGFSAEKLTEEQKEKLDTLEKSTPEVLAIHVFPNLDVSSENDIPSGIVMFLSPDAKVDATILSDNLFQVTAVAKILKGPHSLEGALTDEHFVKKVGALDTAVKQHPTSPLSGEVRHPTTNKDKQPWTPELGGEGSFVGAYYELAENHRDKQYYLVARGTAPLVVQHLKEMINEKQPTYGELLNGDEYRGIMKNSEYTSKRNVMRNLVNAAEAFEVSIRRINDIGAKLMAPGHSQPERAEPEWSFKTCSIRSTMYDNKEAVAMYYGVVPSEDLRALHKDKFFVISNPSENIHTVQLTKESDMYAVPCNTGRAGGSGKGKVVPLAESITWESQGKKSDHPDIKVDSFNKLTPLMRNTLKRSGWEAENPAGVLVRVAVKLHNDSLKRK